MPVVQFLSSASRAARRPHNMSIVETDQARSLRRVQREGVADPMGPFGSRRHFLDFELHRMAAWLERKRLAIEVEQYLKRRIIVSHNASLSYCDNSGKSVTSVPSTWPKTSPV